MSGESRQTAQPAIGPPMVASEALVYRPFGDPQVHTIFRHNKHYNHQVRRTNRLRFRTDPASGRFIIPVDELSGTRPRGAATTGEIEAMGGPAASTEAEAEASVPPPMTQAELGAPEVAPETLSQYPLGSPSVATLIRHNIAYNRRVRRFNGGALANDREAKLVLPVYELTGRACETAPEYLSDIESREMAEWLPVGVFYAFLWDINDDVEEIRADFKHFLGAV